MNRRGFGPGRVGLHSSPERALPLVAASRPAKPRDALLVPEEGRDVEGIARVELRPARSEGRDSFTGRTGPAAPLRAEPGGDHGHPHLVLELVVDHRAEDHVRVLVGSTRHYLGRLVDLEEPEVGGTADVEEDAGGTLDRRLEQRGADRRARRLGRAVMAARAAIASPLLDVSIEGARGVLMNISGGPDLTLAEVTEAAETIQASVDPDADIYFGAVVHPRAQDEVRVTVIATGLQEGSRLAAPIRRSASSESRESEPPAGEYAPPPRERVAPPRERDREPEWASERQRRPAPTEWEREPRPRSDPSIGEGDDDYDVPAFLRRPRH